MRVTFQFAALHYLNLWLLNDRHLHAGITAADAETRLAALAKGAAFFRIARNLPRKYDADLRLPRFSPVLEVIDSLTPADFAEDRTATIINVRDQISARYGNREVLSLTTKFLWIKFRSPIIIYDGQARCAIGTENGDLQAYYSAWQERYDESEPAIDAACVSLVEVLPYSVDTSVATESYVRKLGNSQWFRERVFDIYLWHVGSQ